MNFKILFLLILITFSASSQELMNYKNSKKYKATSNWNFISENYTFTGEVNVQIAKAENNGILKLSVATTNPKFIIGGTIYMYLTDNTVITCTDKGIFENKDNSISSYFMLSNTEMNKLKTTDIQSIRFNIKGNDDNFSSQTGNFTALNKKSYYSTSYNKTKKEFNTAKEITSLYN